MDNDVAKTNDSAIKTAGSFSKANISIVHAQQLSQVLTLQTTLKGQKSFSKNLDSSEDMSVGGSNGVRAYEDSELSGDKGYLKINDISHNTSIFVDSAKIWKNDKVFNTEDNTRKLNAVGVGYALNYKNFDLKATYAHGFGSKDEKTPVSESEFSTNRNKLLVQGMVRF